MKKIILLQNPKSTIKLSSEYIEVFTPQNSFVIAKKFIKAFYINRLTVLPVNTCIKLTQTAPVYFIDSNGYVKARLKGEDEEI